MKNPTKAYEKIESDLDALIIEEAVQDPFAPISGKLLLFFCQTRLQRVLQVPFDISVTLLVEILAEIPTKLRIIRHVPIGHQCPALSLFPLVCSLKKRGQKVSEV